MSIIIKSESIHKPLNCLECPFASDGVYAPDGKGKYDRLAYCMFAEEFSKKDDNWRSEKWRLHNTEKWCPISEVKEA